LPTVVTSSPEEAAVILRAGGTVAFPTETVYGLGADAFAPAALRAVFTAKGRPGDNPLIVHIAHLGQLAEVAGPPSASAALLIERFFPGPLTVILPRHPALPDEVTAGLETVGVRMPAHPVARAFLDACGRPVAAPSANQSGRPSPTTWQAVYADLNGRIDCLLRGGRSQAGLESTVVDCTGAVPYVLRAGVIPLEALQAVLPETRLAEASEPSQPRSPGLRHRHYAPRAAVRLVGTPAEAAPGPDAAYIGLAAPPAPAAFGLTARCDSVEAYAYELFDFFRRCDDAGIATIFCQTVPPAGLGRALMDRLGRAARG
jgi:L-threonylcarbamoyladenylate synthase